MSLALFVSFVLSLTMQSADLDTHAWRSSAPDPVTDQAVPTQRQPSHAAEANPATGNPSGLPTILGEESPQENSQNQPPESGLQLFSFPNNPPHNTEGPTSRTEEAAQGSGPRDMQGTTPRVLQADPSNETLPPNRPAPSSEIKLLSGSNSQRGIARTSHEAPAMNPRAHQAINTTQEPSVTSDDFEQLIHDSIALPKQDARISGRPLRLLDVLSASPVLLQPQPRRGQYGGQPKPVFNGQMQQNDPQEEQKRVLAYWQLAQSLGQYNLSRQLVDFWASVSALPDDETLLRAARASANSLLCESRVTLVTDQHSLGEVANLVPEAGLPLPSDPPHVGTYFTHFDKIFAAGPAPALGRRLNATLPLCRDAVESRAGSTLAARNAVELLSREYAAGRCTFAKLASAVAQWREEHRAFLRSAYVYNFNICEYVISVAGLPADRGTLVTMLIRPTYPVTPETPLQPMNELPMVNGNGLPTIVNGSPTLAPPLRQDPSVQPVSGEYPLLEADPSTQPVLPNQTDPRFLPIQ